MAGEEPVVETSAAAPPAVEAPAPAAPPAEPQHPSEIPTLLETLKAPGVEAPKVEEKPAEKPVEVKPVEAKPPEKPAEVKVEPAKAEEPKAEETKTEPPVEAPVDYKFEFAENVTPQAEKVAAFTEFAREHKLTPEAAQKAVGYFNDAATAFVADQQRKQVETWNTMRSDWRKQVLADPMVGGAGHLQAMGVVARVRDMSISDHQAGTPQYDKDAREFEDFLRTTGAGDHPAFHKMLYRLGHRLDEPKMITAVPNPPKNNGARPSNSLYAPSKRQ